MIKKGTKFVARTPLTQFLQALSSDVDSRKARALSATKPLSAWTRREFVAGAVATAASAALPRAAFAALPKPRIAIVGAGIAGLNAALALQNAGVPSAVYEASNRIGGRMFSANLDLG